ncbi:right-handed parallel beta-helix repeat-containing protein [Candidatus Binatia bacterium]|nr:right-handed parallel beta-helix repeat-containing protein [Candidatus Binatia bacterium]
MNRSLDRSLGHRATIVLAAMLLAAAAGRADATTYFVTAAGDDGAAGTTRAAAWRTLDRVNTADLEPGDRVLLEGQTTFPGPLVIGPEDAGTRSRPVTIRSFGGGRATIDAGTGRGIFVHDAGGVQISGLNVVGAGRESGNSSDGIAFYSDVAVPGTRFARIRVQSVDVSGFGGAGLSLGGYATDAAGRPVKTGFADVQIVRVDAHDNADAGILSYGSYGTEVTGWAHADVSVVACRSWANPGIPGKGGNSGNGIVLADVDGGRIRRSYAWDNGFLNDHPSGPVGIWTWDSNRVTISFNEAWGNRSGTKDGGGFDLDGGATNCALHDNTSHDDAGAGFLVYQFAGARPMHDNEVVDNVSVDDGRSNGGGLVVGGGAVRTTFARNMVELAARDAGTPTADGPYGIHVVRDGATNVDTTFEGNVIAVQDGVPLIVVPEPSRQTGLVFRGNVYDAHDGPVSIVWGDTAYSSVESWSAATGLGP